MQSRSVVFCILLVVAAAASPASATTVVPMELEDLVHQAGWIVEGTVVDLEAFATGSRPPGEQRTVVPVPPMSEEDGTEPPRATQPPAALGVEGGRMIHTRVTLKVDREIVGRIGGTVTFRIAGGTLDGERAVVFGMPTFELGKRYVVFLRPDFERTGAPLVGVHQGFFRVEKAPDRSPEILDFDGDVVVAVKNGRMVVRHGRGRPDRPRPSLGPVPTPETGVGTHAGRSPEVTRYWRSTDPPLPPERFYAAIRSLRGVAR